MWKKNNFGFGAYFRNQAEYAFLLQKYPTNSKVFKNRSLGNVWEENVLPTDKQHPHQKPRGLIKTLILATTQKEDLIVDPCAGSFVVLEVCRELNRKFLGCDLTYEKTQEFRKQKKADKIYHRPKIKPCCQKSNSHLYF